MKFDSTSFRGDRKATQKGDWICSYDRGPRRFGVEGTGPTSVIFVSYF